MRERLAYAEHEIPNALGRLRQEMPAIGEVALLSTCNRVELIGLTRGGQESGSRRHSFSHVIGRWSIARLHPRFTIMRDRTRYAICFE